jgi:hypothetical protein
MIRDPIVEEVRETRRKTEEACEQNWELLFAHFERVQKASDHPIIKGAPKHMAKEITLKNR